MHYMDYMFTAVDLNAFSFRDKQPIFTKLGMNVMQVDVISNPHIFISYNLQKTPQRTH